MSEKYLCYTVLVCKVLSQSVADLERLFCFRKELREVEKAPQVSR